MTDEHVYKFSRDWADGKRLCGECHLTYENGNHTHVAVLEPYTSYICPNDTGQGHKSVWSGSQATPELRRLDDDICTCGTRLVKEDTEVWRISFELKDPQTGQWRPVQRLDTKHSTHQQRDGLLTMPDDIRNVQLVRIDDQRVITRFA